MGKHCDVTGELASQCDCGAHDDDETPEPWREIPFRTPRPEPETDDDGDAAA